MPSPDDAPPLSPAREAELRELAERIGHEFKSLTTLDRALCHSSTGNERPDSYERLEFLGDAILGFLVAEELFNRQPEIPEGELTDRRAHIVSRKPLARIADTLQLTSYLIGGRGLREQDRRSDRIRADLVEALIAAVYLDSGIRAARKFVKRHVLPQEKEQAPGPAPRDPKSRLLHHAQVSEMGQPSYKLVRSWGPDHERQFEVAVMLQGEQRATGRGRTKQQAEKEAAARALEALLAEQSEAGEQEPGESA